jgi:hypothetical protein
MAALLMVVAILSAVTRFAVRLTTLGTMKADDYLLSAATVSAFITHLNTSSIRSLANTTCR